MLQYDVTRLNEINVCLLISQKLSHFIPVLVLNNSVLGIFVVIAFAQSLDSVLNTLLQWAATQ